MANSLFSTDLIAAETRIACRIEYDGSAYSGWQLQPHEGVVTVQEKVELALSKIAAHPVRVHCAGRTDAGVHAVSQIIHFDAPATRSCKAWVIGGNANLPRDIRIHWAVPVTKDFHARFSAESRCYRYVIANTPIRSALLLKQVTWHRCQLDQLLMDKAAQTLLGERDFSAFRAASCQSASPMRNVQFIEVQRRGDLVIIEIVANAFLHHMVRNVAGALLAVGDGRKSLEWIVHLMAGRDRSLGVETAPASGLYLADVEYSAHCRLPKTPYGPALIEAKL